MLRDASIAPAESPSGIAKRHIINRLPEMENPTSEIAVKAVLRAVTFAVPSRFVMRVAKMLEITVHPQVRVVTMLGRDSGNEKSSIIAGIAAPKSESGTPSPINAMYIIAKSSVAIIFIPPVIVTSFTPYA